MIYPVERARRPESAVGEVVVVIGADTDAGALIACEAARHGARVVAPPIGSAAATAVGALARRIGRRWGRIDAWVTVIQGSLPNDPGRMTPAALRRRIDARLVRPMRRAEAVLPTLEPTGGTLICVATLGGAPAARASESYAIADRALASWRDDLRRSLRERGSDARVAVLLRWRASPGSAPSVGPRGNDARRPPASHRTDPGPRPGRIL